MVKKNSVSEKRDAEKDLTTLLFKKICQTTMNLPR